MGGFTGIDFLDELDLTEFFNNEVQNCHSSEDDFKTACLNLWDKFRKEKGIKKDKNTYEYDAMVLHTVFCKINQGDYVLCPDDCGNFVVGKVVGDYEYKDEWVNLTEKQTRLTKYQPKRILPHRRRVEWMFDRCIPGRRTPVGLRRQLSNSRALAYLGKTNGDNGVNHAEYIHNLLSKADFPFSKTYTGYIAESAESEENLERHLFKQLQVKTEIGPLEYYELFGTSEIDKELIAKLNIEPSIKAGRMVKTSVGVIDFLMYNKEQNQLMVIGLKRKQSPDEAVGRMLHYMGYMRQELKNVNPAITVKGCIISHGENQNILCAIETLADVDYYRYEASNKELSDLKLIKV